MRSERAKAALLAIQLHGREAQVFLDGVSRDAFRQDRRTFHAVTRCLEIISEATRRLPEPLKARTRTCPGATSPTPETSTGTSTTTWRPTSSSRPPRLTSPYSSPPLSRSCAARHSNPTTLAAETAIEA